MMKSLEILAIQISQAPIFGTLALLLFTLVACQDVNAPRKPDNLIPKEMMVDILTDCYINNAARSISYVKLKDSGIKLDSMIYLKYQIDSVQFTLSNEYYSLQFNTYIDMLTQVEERLEKIKSQTDSIAPGTTPSGLIESVDSETVQDSIE